MKAMQTVFSLVLIVALIFGVAFVWQKYFVGRTPSGTEAGPKPTKGAPAQLTFPQPVAEWSPSYANWFEVKSTGHWDFWFHNPHGQAITLGVEMQSCKCSKLEACTFPSALADRLRQWQATAEAFQVLRAHNKFVDVLTQHVINETLLPKAMGVELRWHELHREDKKVPATTVMVEPGASGLVRMGWEAKQVGEERLSAELWSQPARDAAPRAYQRLEVPVVYGEAFAVDPGMVSVENLNPREKKQVVFWCWSGTRAHFDLQAQVVNRDKVPDPCFQCSWRPMTWEEREALAQRLNTRALYGYLIQVEVNERLSESVQLDLGPFRRRLSLTSDPGLEPVGPIIGGTVRGEVTVGSPDDKDRIDLKSFRADAGKKVQVPIATEAGVELQTEMIEFEPDFLKVELKKVYESKGNAGAGWLLTVEVPPNRAAGPLPSASAIFLKTKGPTPRRIRIPINGIAYNR